jgi:hypothetical protein
LVVERTSPLGASPARRNSFPSSPIIIMHSTIVICEGSKGSGDFPLCSSVADISICEHQCQSVSKKSCKSCKSCQKNLPAYVAFSRPWSSSRRDWSSFWRLLSSFRVVSSSFRRPLSPPITLQNPIFTPENPFLTIFLTLPLFKGEYPAGGRGYKTAIRIFDIYFLIFDITLKSVDNKKSEPQIARHASAADRDRVASIWTKICAGNRPARSAGRAGRVVERTNVFGVSPAWPDLSGAISSHDFLCVNLCLKSCLSCKSRLKNLHALQGLHGKNCGAIGRPFGVFCHVLVFLFRSGPSKNFRRFRP